MANLPKGSQIVGESKLGPVALAPDGTLYLGRGNAPGLGSLGFNWDAFGKIIAPVTSGFGQYLAGKGQNPYAYNPTQGQYYQQPGGAYISASPSGGLLGGIDTTTLLLIGLAVFLFLSKR